MTIMRFKVFSSSASGFSEAETTAHGRHATHHHVDQLCEAILHTNNKRKVAWMTEADYASAINATLAKKNRNVKQLDVRHALRRLVKGRYMATRLIGESRVYRLNPTGLQNWRDTDKEYICINPDGELD